MRPHRTEFTDDVYHLRGGTEDNDLWTYTHEAVDGDFVGTVICSVWVPTPEERERISNGENIRLVIWGKQPPVAMDLTDEKILGVER